MWNAIKKFFKYSETIFLARLQVLIGTVLEILVVMDPALFAPLLGEYFPPLHDSPRLHTGISAASSCR